MYFMTHVKKGAFTKTTKGSKNVTGMKTNGLNAEMKKSNVAKVKISKQFIANKSSQS